MSFIKASLKGISQVILIENALTGLVALIGITVASYTLGIIAGLSALIGTAVGRFGGVERTVINQGLFGYNAVLTGIALMLFLNDHNRWWISLIGAFISSVFTAAMMYWLGRLRIPVLTFPFIVVTWFVLLLSYHFDSIRLSPGLVPKDITLVTTNVRELPDFLSGWVHGIGQVYIIDHFWSGIIILVGVFFAGWKPGVYAVIGTVVSSVEAYFLQGNISWLNMGLYGYNAVLTILAVSYVFTTRRRFVVVIGIITSMVSVLVAAGLSVFLTPYGLPVFTMPFTLTVWVYLSAVQILRNW